jgi:TP901 family phage tail tape measure protein
VTSQLLKLQATTIGLNKNLTSQVGVMNRQFDETMRSTGQFSRHFVTLTSDVSKFGQNLDSGRMKLGQYFQTWQGHTRKTSTLVKELAKQQVMLENAVVQPLGKNAQGLMQYNVMVQSGLDATKNKSALLRQELSIMNKVMMDGSNQLINWGKNTQWAGRQLTVGLTVPLAAFGMAAAKAFRQADEELVRLTKVYGGLTATSSEDLLRVRKDVAALSRELASGLGANFTETIALAADIAATGKEGTELLDSTRQTTRLAILGEVDRQEAMKATLSIQTAFGQSTEQLAQSIDFLNAVENQTSTSLADLVEAIPKAGPVVKALGGDVQDLALYLTAMREGGINASEGANALKSALASIINPTKVAKEQFMGFGIDLGGIVDKNAGNLTGTVMALKDSLDSLDPLSRARAIEQLFGKFQFARINALFENLGKEGSQTLQVLDLMKASTQDLASISERELKAMTESASGKYKRALEAVKADLAVIGEQFLKVGTFVLNAIDGIVKFIGNLPGPIKAVLGFIGSLTAIAGPIIMLTGVLANFFGYIIKGIFALKNIGKGGTGFKLLTPELMAASAAAETVEQAFYSDTKAAATFSDAVMTLAASFEKLRQNAMSATVATSNSMSTVGGNTVMRGGGRIVDKENPLVGKAYSRDMSHVIPTGSKTPQQRADETIFSTVPGPKPVNLRLSNSAQTYMNDDLPRINGVTSVNGVSNGIVAAEAAKWHSMTAALAMQSKAEIAQLKAEVAATGTVTASLTDSYQALLPQMTKITSLAADETALIVKQLQAGKITVEAARAKIFALNAQVEAMMVQTAQGVATAQARNISLATVPLTTQPVVSAAGKSNMKELFHKTETSKLVDSIARGLGVRTSGAGYSIQTTKPRRLNAGGRTGGVYEPEKHGAVVPGDTSINYDNTPARVPLGGFVLNQEASRNNPELVERAKQSYGMNGGGKIDAVLTPGETVVDPKTYSENQAAYDKANSTKRRIEFRSMGGVLGGLVIPKKRNYGNKLFADEALSVQKLEEAYRYVDNLTGDSYEELRRPGIVLNNADALFRHVPGMTMQRAVAEARAIDVVARRSHQLFVASNGEAGMDYHTAHAKYLEAKYPHMILPSGSTKQQKRAASGTKDVQARKQMALMVDSVFPGASSDEWAHRAHFVPIEQSRGHKGYFGEAGHDRFNLIGEDLRKTVGVNDISPVFSQEAKAHADHIAQGLGFEDADDFLLNKEKIKEFIKTGKWKGPGPVPLGLAKYLRANTVALKATNPRVAAANPRVAIAQKIAGARRNAGGILGGLVKSGKRNYGNLFLGMPRGIKAVETQRKARLNMEEIDAGLKASRFAAMPPTDFGKLISPSTGRSFPVPGIGGLYEKADGTRVFVKPVMDETAALAEQRATIIAREAHGLNAPKQEIRTMIDPTDPAGRRKLLVLESPYDEAFAKASGEFTKQDYFKQLVAANLRGDRDLSPDNLYGSTLNDVGTAGVFKMASGKRTYEENMTSMKDQANINLLGVKGGARRFFAESTLAIPKGMTPKQYHKAMIDEIDEVLPRLEETVAKSLGQLNAQESAVYAAMIQRLKDGRKVNWEEFHGIHSAVKVAAPKALTPAALKKLKEEAELRIRQRGHAISLSDNSFKTPLNGFNGGGLIGNVLKGVAMRKIGAGFGPTGAPKPSMYESAPWGVNSLSIQMAETLFANSGLRKNTQKLLYDKFAAALAKEKPYGYVKGKDGSLQRALEPDSLDAVIRLAASDLFGDRNVIRQLSPIDKDILRNKYLNWDSKKNTPMTAELQKKIFGIDGKREMGGPVSPGQNYVVGEKGPEIFSPSQSGKIIPGFALGGMIKRSKDFYGEKITDVSQITSQGQAKRLLKSGDPSQRALGQLYLNNLAAGKVPAPAPARVITPGPLSVAKTTIVGNGGVRTNAYGLQGSLPYAPGLKLPLRQFNMAIDSALLSITNGLKTSSTKLITRAKIAASDISASINALGTKIKDSGFRTAGMIQNRKNTIGEQKTIAASAPGPIFNPAYIDRSGKEVPASRADKAIRRSFMANARYSTSAMAHPVQYMKAKGIVNPELGGGGIGMMAGSLGGMAAGYAIGDKLGGQNGAMMGSMVGSMAGPSLIKGAGKMVATRAAASAATAGLASAGFGATAAAAAGLVAPLAAVTAAVYVGYKAWKHYKEGQTLNISTFGMTAEAAKKANLRFTDFGAKIKDTIQDSKDMAAANKLVYESMKDGGTPFQMTIAEYKKLKVEVKETFGEQIKALDRQPSNKVPDAVRRIKEQLIAAGMSAEEATKKVYTMLQLSNKKDQSITATMGNKDFKNITDAQTAAVSSVTSFGKDTRDQGNKEKAASLNTALMATETGINDLIAKRERLVAKDLSGKTKSLSYTEAEKIMIDQLNTSKEATTKITQGTVDEIAKTNPEVKKMINGSDTIVSTWQKIRLEALGFKGDLSKLNAEQAAVAANLFSSVSESVQKTNKEGILKGQYENLEKLKGQIASYTKALKGQTAAQQISDRDKLSALNKQIEANNKLAEARKKALTAAQADADLGREIEKTRMQMQNAAASGDTQKAQELRLDLETLTTQQQTESQTKAIDKANEAANAPLKAAIEAMGNKQQKLADSAALAGDSLDKIRDKYDKQLAAIDKVNNSMTALYANAKLAGVSIEDYVKKNKEAASALVADYEAATGKKMDRYTVGKDGKKVPIDPTTNALSVLSKSGAQSGIDALKITGGKTLKDVYDAIKNPNAKAPLRKDIAVSGDYSKSMEEKTFNGVKTKVLNAEAREAIGKRENLQLNETFIWNGQRYGKSQKNGNIVFMGKAATGVQGGMPGMYLVGENGPEMVHLKNRANIMPNDVMKTLAAASPRYNFNKAQYNMKEGTASGNSYVVNQNIYASEGMDVEALSNMIIKKAEVVIGQKAKINVKMVGQGKNI